MLLSEIVISKIIMVSRAVKMDSCRYKIESFTEVVT